jgi:hypothetical protein
MTQKFFKGDLVQLGEMPLSMRYFFGNSKAIVIASYSELHGRSGAGADKSYTLFILDVRKEVSWYLENQMTLIEPDRFDLLPKTNVHRKVWEAKRKRDQA